jgi:hypothetical protein
MYANERTDVVDARENLRWLDPGRLGVMASGERMVAQGCDHGTRG